MNFYMLNCPAVKTAIVHHEPVLVTY